MKKTKRLLRTFPRTSLKTEAESLVAESVQCADAPATQVAQAYQGAPLKVVTFGSCLSKYLTEALARAGVPLVRQGSVYHNRIDIFVDVYVAKVRPPMPREVITQLAFKEGTQRENLALINNQMADAEGTLGKHLSAGQPGFMAALADADVILMDNFIDLAAQVLQRKDGTERLFFNYKALSAPFEQFKGIGMLKPEIGLSKWKQLVAWIRTQNPTAKLVFSQFPYVQHRNAQIRQLGETWNEVMKQLPDVLYFEGAHVAPEELVPGTQAHFVNAVYDRYVPRLCEFLAQPAKR